MRRQMLGLTAMLLVLSPCVGEARRQPQQGSIPTPGGQRVPSLPSIADPQKSGETEDPMSPMREANRARSLANERQKRIVQDTAKLLSLATELKADVDTTTKNEMSLDVIKKAEEIERLAHDVKQRMKGQ